MQRLNYSAQAASSLARAKRAKSAAKSAVAMIEMVFAIVLMGLAMSALPGVIMDAKISGDRAAEREYLNVLRLINGISAKMPYSQTNVCRSAYKANSFLTQFCADTSGIVVKQKNMGEYSLDASTRSEPRLSGAGPSSFEGWNNATKFLEMKTDSKIKWFDIYGAEVSGVLIGEHSVDLAEAFPAISTFATGISDATDFLGAVGKKIGIKVEGLSDNEIVFNSYGGKMGRTESLYHTYVLQYRNTGNGSESSWNGRRLLQDLHIVLSEGFMCADGTVKDASVPTYLAPSTPAASSSPEAS